MMSVYLKHLSKHKLSERFFDIWRQLRRGKALQTTAPLFFDLPNGKLTSGEADILQVLMSYPDGCGMGTLSDEVELDRGNTTRTVEMLREKQLVERTGSSEDGRIKRISLTPKGQAVALAHTDLRSAIFEAAMAGLAPEQKQLLVESLEHVVQKLRTFDAAEG